MRQRLRSAAVGVCLAFSAGNGAWGQDPVEVLPHAYQRVLENEWVRVVRVRYAPHEKLGPHYHTERAAAYVYLNDSGPVLFQHVDLPYSDVVRPPTKAGSFRLFRGVKEVHSVENPNDVESHFLRVELKTEVVEVARLRGRYYREDYPPGENVERVQFENGQVRITRVVIAPGSRLELVTAPDEPALLVALVPARLSASRSAGGPQPLDLELGGTQWLDSSSGLGLENRNEGTSDGAVAGSAQGSVELLRFDFKTRPFDDPGDRTEGHDHGPESTPAGPNAGAGS